MTVPPVHGRIGSLVLAAISLVATPFQYQPYAMVVTTRPRLSLISENPYSTSGIPRCRCSDATEPEPISRVAAHVAPRFLCSICRPSRASVGRARLRRTSARPQSEWWPASRKNIEANLPRGATLTAIRWRRSSSISYLLRARSDASHRETGEKPLRSRCALYRRPIESRLRLVRARRANTGALTRISAS